MYSMVLMAALTTGTDMPDLGRRRGGGGCCGGGYSGMCYGGGYGCCGGGYVRGGCYGGGYGGCYGSGYGGCYGGGWGSCYGGGRVGWGGCYGGGYAGGCYGGRTWGGGYGGGYAWGGMTPLNGYAVGPTIYGSNLTTPLVMDSNTYGNLETNQSFYLNPNSNNSGTEATIIVHLPANARLTIDGQATQSTAATRTFVSPPLEAGKTYTYTLHGELNRDGRRMTADQTVEVRAGGRSEITLNFSGTNPQGEQISAPPSAGRPRNPVNPPAATPRRARSLPTPPDDQ